MYGGHRVGSAPRKADADRLLGEHRQYLRVRAAWQVEVLDPYPVRTRRRRRLRAVLTLAGMSSSGWGAVVVVATFG